MVDTDTVTDVTRLLTPRHHINTALKHYLEKQLYTFNKTVFIKFNI